MWLVAASGPAHAVEPVDRFPTVAAAYLIEAEGKIVASHRADRRLPPASLTKIMTALLVLERGRLDDVVTVSAAATRETGTRVGLRPGERLAVKYLLAIALVQSANDACHALAAHVAGDEARFVAQMNRRASTLGLADTHFVNACGHDHPRHSSTARDLLRLTHVALQHPLFVDLVAAVELHVPTVDGTRSFHLVNNNELVGRYPGATGVKSGYTPKAGKCLVALAERDRRRVLLVLLNAPDRWWTAVDMLDHAFAQLAGGAASGPR